MGSLCSDTTFPAPASPPQSLECGANPAAQGDSFPGLMEDLRASRPGLAVYWRSGDDPEGGPHAA